jgi:small conductance mechanosensitive channel
MGEFWESLPWDHYRVLAAALLVRIGTGCLVLVLFWLVGGMLHRLVVRLCAGRAVHEDLVLFLARSARLSLVTVGIVTALGTIGVDVTALVAGLGLVGFALGFALKDLISNALAGVLILLYKPYQRNDRITVDPHEGIVVEINMRYTVLSTEGARILIPNANMFTNAIKVATRS